MGDEKYPVGWSCTEDGYNLGTSNTHTFDVIYIRAFRDMHRKSFVYVYINTHLHSLIHLKHDPFTDWSAA